MLATSGHVDRPEESAIGQCTHAANAVVSIRPHPVCSNPHTRVDNAFLSGDADAATIARSTDPLALAGARGPLTSNHQPTEVTS